MMDSTLSSAAVRVDASGEGIVSHAGVVLPIRTAERFGLVTALSQALSAWRAPTAHFDPGRVLVQLAAAVAAGGDCLADLRTLAGAESVVGTVPSEATVSRLVGTLAADSSTVESAVAAAITNTRQQVWKAAGRTASAADPHVIDLDATILVAHSDKQDAAPTWKKTFGHHPLLAYLDHGDGGTGEPVAALLRPGNAGANTAADHITVLASALEQIPGINSSRPGRSVLVRTDGAGASHTFLQHLTRKRALPDSECIDPIPQLSGVDQ